MTDLSSSCRYNDSVYRHSMHHLRKLFLAPKRTAMFRQLILAEGISFRLSQIRKWTNVVEFTDLSDSPFLSLPAISTIRFCSWVVQDVYKEIMK